jgi:hypothetical protein
MSDGLVRLGRLPQDLLYDFGADPEDMAGGVLARGSSMTEASDRDESDISAGGPRPDPAT